MSKCCGKRSRSAAPFDRTKRLTPRVAKSRRPVNHRKCSSCGALLRLSVVYTSRGEKTKTYACPSCGVSSAG